MAMTIRLELAQSLRRFWRRPGQSLLAVTVLGGGLAAFLFTLLMLDGIVRARPPYAEPERIVNLSYSRADNPRARSWIPLAEVRELQPQLRSLDRSAAYTETPMALRDEAEPTRLTGALVGHELFEVLGVAPALGRPFDSGDDTVAAPLVALIGDALWRTRYGADPGVVGRPVHVDGRAATIIGVMPASFTFPFSTDMWVPARLDDPALASETFMLTGRLRDGAVVADTRGEFERYVGNLAAHKRGAAAAAMVPRTTPMLEWVVNPNTRYFIWLMLSCGAMVVLLAASNVSYLLLAQVAQRHNELSTRSALGGSFGRLAASLLIDTAVVCATATIVGLGAARLAGQWLSARLASDGDPLPPWMDLGLSATVVGWAIVVSATVTLLVAVASMWRVGRLARAPQLRVGGSVGPSASRARISSAFTGIQVALACTLMLCAVVCVRMLLAALDLETGIASDPERLLGAEIALPAGADAAAARRRAEAIAERVRTAAGVEAVTLASRLPGSYGSGAAVRIEGIEWGGDATRMVYRTAIDEHYVAALGITLSAGRGFNADDVREGRDVAVIDAQFAGQLLAGADPIGRRLQLDPGLPGSPWLTIIGVTAALHPVTPDEPQTADVFVPFKPTQDRFFGLVARTSGDAALLSAQLPKLVAAVEPETSTYAIRSYAQNLDLGVRDVLMITQILIALAGLGLALSAAGLYATLALAVTQRTREIGLRRAVGASAADVVVVVVRRSLVAVVLGTIVGALCGGPIASGLAARGDAVQAVDPLLFAIVVGTIALAAATAMLVPARRATRVEPLVALRHE